MPREPRKRKPPQSSEPVGDPRIPRGFGELAENWFEWMRVRNYSEATVKGGREALRTFARWCGERGIERPMDVTRSMLERYQKHLFHYRKANGQPLSFSSQHHFLSALKQFFKWATRHGQIEANPASELEMPRLEKRLPRQVLTSSETEEVLKQCDITALNGMRDRAMLETLYSTGMRRKELCWLDLFDLDLERGTVLIRCGKGKKDRWIPIGDRALAWIGKYLIEARPRMIQQQDDGTLFIGRFGKRFTPDGLTQLVSEYVAKAELGKTGSCHMFRHTCATVMIENGADIRFIQQLLGHSKLDSTQIYTHVSIRQLKAIHAATHPARLQTPEPPGAAGEQCRKAV